MNKKHGMRNTKTYNSYKSMKERCLNFNHKNYEYYSKVGICGRWLESFSNFYADMGDRPDGTTLDRIDNSKGYSKDNCRWATRVEQNINRASYSNTGHKNISKHTQKKGEYSYETFFVQVKRNGKVYNGSARTLEDAIIKREQALEKVKGME